MTQTNNPLVPDILLLSLILRNPLNSSRFITLTNSLSKTAPNTPYCPTTLSGSNSASLVPYEGRLEVVAHIVRLFIDIVFEGRWGVDAGVAVEEVVGRPDSQSCGKRISFRATCRLT